MPTIQRHTSPRRAEATGRPIEGRRGSMLVAGIALEIRRS